MGKTYRLPGPTQTTDYVYNEQKWSKYNFLDSIFKNRLKWKHTYISKESHITFKSASREVIISDVAKMGAQQ